MLIPKWPDPQGFHDIWEVFTAKERDKNKQLGEESLQREAVFNNHRSIREEPEPLIQKEKDIFFF